MREQESERARDRESYVLLGVFIYENAIISIFKSNYKSAREKNVFGINKTDYKTSKHMGRSKSNMERVIELKIYVMASAHCRHVGAQRCGYLKLQATWLWLGEPMQSQASCQGC